MARAARSRTATQRALDLLTRREHSRKELQRKLTARGEDPQQAAQAVAKLADLGWQDDGRFAESLVRRRVSTGYGPLHIRAELNLHGLSSEAVAAAMATMEEDWNQTARDWVRRRFGEPPLALPLARKAADWLMRRGFDGEAVRAATRISDED